MTTRTVDAEAAPCAAAELLAVALPGAALVWRFCDAPEALRDLSTNGGGEDWLVLMHDDHPALVYGGAPWTNRLGTSDPERHDLPGGFVVLIGSHA